MNLKFSLFAFAFFSILLFSLFSQIAFATTYLQAYATGIVQPSANITIQGQIVNTSTADTIEGINVSASVASGGSGDNITSPTGTFEFNVTAPSSVGTYTVVVETNESTPKSKSIPVYVSNITGGSVSYTSGLPPYSPGDKFTINVTLLNGTTSVASYPPDIAVYVANGQQVSWTITSFTTVSDTNGVMRYNITIPSSASPGQYAIVVDKGAISSVFTVQSGYVVLVNPETTDAEVTLNFAPDSTVMILARIQTTGGVAVGSAASSVTAYVILPNGTVSSLTLQARDQTSYPGYYNNTFTDTSSSGMYNVRVDAVIGGSAVQGYTLFSIKTFNVRLEPETKFFMEWGGSAAFGAGQTVGLNIIATNLTTDEIFTVSASGIPECNTTYLQLLDVFFPNGTSVNATHIQNAAFSTGRYMMSQVCKIQFTGPNVSSPYGIKVNVTIGSTTQTAEGYFSIQKYFLKPTTVAGFGGEMEMMSMVAPGENTTISLSAYNITNKEAVGGANITNVTVKKIVPLEFSRGISEIAGTDINYSVSYGASPTITLTVPDNIMGPTSVEIQANISGETVRGNTFFIANYLMGFLMPQIAGADGGPGGGGPPFSSCSGEIVFSGTLKEVKTAQAVTAGAAVINTIEEATEEFTGKDVSDYITLTANGTSQSGGSISVNLTFASGYSFSGFYFAILNASYQGKSAGIPAGFMCKQLNYWPNVYSVGGGQSTWRIAPESGVTIVISNITRMNDSRRIRNATVKIPRIFNFNPGKGGERILTPTAAFNNWVQDTSNFNYTHPTRLSVYWNWTNGTGLSEVQASWNITSNMANITIYPQNFTLDGTTALQKWPNGFVDLQPQICTDSLGSTVDSNDTDTWGCDTGFGGFQVTPFDAWTENFQWGQSLSVNASLSYIVSAKTNVSLGCTGTTCDRTVGSVYTNYSDAGGNNTGFTVKIGRPWEGELTTITGVSAELISDQWNSTSDWASERWRVNFTIPATVKKGEAMLLITVNNSYGETADDELWTTFTKYSITIPYEEGISDWWNGDTTDPSFTAESGWNMTQIEKILGIGSKSNQVCYHFGFNTTRWCEGPACAVGGANSITMNYNATMNLLLVDNTTSGVYDYLVFNISNTTFGYVNDTNRTISLNAYAKQGVYLRKIEGCGYVKIINATGTAAADVAVYGSLPSWAGDDEANKLFTVPYVVKLGNNPVADAGVHVNSIILQNDEGFGFEEKLAGGYDANGLTAAGQNYSYINATTDSAGVAFLKVNITSSGRFNIFWKVNVSATDYDIATFASGTTIEMRKFKGWGDGIYWLPKGNVSLKTHDQSLSSMWNAFDNTTVSDVYYGNASETAANDFVRDGSTTGWHIVYNPYANRTCLDDDANFTYGDSNDPDNPDTGNYPVLCFYLNTSSDSLNTGFGAQSNTQLAVGAVENDTAVNNMTFVFYQNDPTLNMESLSIDSGSNITVKVCAETFADPSNTPIEGATVKLFARSFAPMGPPTTTWLTMYDPLNGTAYTGGSSAPASGIFTGPKGCVAFNMTHPSGWSMGCTEIQGTVTSGTNTENIWVGRVCR